MNRLKFLLLSSGLALLTGCVVMPPEHHNYYVGQPVMEAPPPLREEVIGIAPAPGYIWIRGYWGWHKERYDWVPGYWSAPRPGYRWVPHEWVHEGPHWRLQEGHWEHHGRH